MNWFFKITTFILVLVFFFVAIKKCHINFGKNSNKLKERWEREVNYMTNVIKNENIVRGVNVKPESFLVEMYKTNPSGMPILVMEFCNGGDLRSHLNESKNCSGLLESEVRGCLQSLISAVAHLHSMSITHRDIKPENVVIHAENNGRTVYKVGVVWLGLP